MAAITQLTPIVNAYQNDVMSATDIKSRVSGATITTGLIVYDDPTTGTMKISDAAGGATTEQVYGIQVDGYTTPSGQVCTIMRRGVVAGFDLSSQNFGALIYLDTAGTLVDAPNSTKTVVIGKVVGSSELTTAGVARKLLAVAFADLSVIS